LFSWAGENLTLRLRKQAFEAMMKQEIGWFDLSDNSTGALCQKLSGDAAAVQGVRRNNMYRHRCKQIDT